MHFICHFSKCFIYQKGVSISLVVSSFLNWWTRLQTSGKKGIDWKIGNTKGREQQKITPNGGITILELTTQKQRSRNRDLKRQN